MYRGFVRLRGVYIKLGQILSIMGTFLPREYTEELEALQDDVPPQSYKQITTTFVEVVRQAADTRCSRASSEEPIAAASLGQVHEARNAAGDRLAVKILYPNVATIIKVDLRVLGWALRVYKNFVPIQQIERVHEQLADMLARETDLANEARCIDADGEELRRATPTCCSRRSTRSGRSDDRADDVVHGRRQDHEEGRARRRSSSIPYDVATKLTKVFYKQLFIDRFFHADPHPGNFFVQRGPEGQVRIVVLDLGSATELRDNLADGMFDILQRPDDAQGRPRRAGHRHDGLHVADGGDRALLERTMRKYFEKLLNLNITDFGKIDPEVAQQLADPDMKRDELRELMKSVAYPEGWFYVERAAVIMFGLSATLAPKLNGIQVGFPYVMQFIMERQQRKAEPAPAKPALAESAEEALLN